MKKKFISIITSIIVAALLIPVGLGVGAQEVFGLMSGSSFSSFLSYIIFYNTKDEQTVLYVKKEVKNPDPDNKAPSEDEFEFTLKLNGSVASEYTYELYNADGKKIYNYDTEQTIVEDKTKFEVERKTDRFGKFKLKDGQTAKFEALSPGDSYEIEESHREPYTQTKPKGGGAAKGTVPPEGARVTFENTYKVPGSGQLEVRKYISYPDNYEVPETPAFEFEIKVDNKLYADQEYLLKDIETDEVLNKTLKTDSKGRLVLQGNTYAVFENVPLDVDYSVEEILSDAAKSQGWRAIGETLQEGGTGENGNIASFTNILASFAVSKEMYGGIAVDTPFSFQVFSGNGTPFEESLSYYLYDKTLQLIDEEPHQTGEDGTFTLKPGQRAVFTGLENGTVYGVREISSGRYIQYLPTTGAGYTGKIVEDSVEVLPFINAVSPSPTLLTVKKKLVDNSEDGSAPDINFSFRISKLIDGEYKPIANAAYDIIDATGTSTYSTDAEGLFTLKAWETARFTKLNKNDTYKVEEITTDLHRGFSAGGSTSKEGVLGDDVLEMEFENNYEEPGDPYVSIIKKNVAGNMLAGATLQLIKKNDDKTETVMHEWISKATPEEFQVPLGKYYIRELEAPQGYAVAEDAEITIKETNKLQQFSMVDERDTIVPTGVEQMRTPIVRIIIILVIVLAVLAAVYFGFIRRRTKS